MFDRGPASNGAPEFCQVSLGLVDGREPSFPMQFVQAGFCWGFACRSDLASNTVVRRYHQRCNSRGPLTVSH